MKMMRFVLHAAVALALLCGLGWMVPAPSRAAAVIQVDTFADDFTSNGNCTLREAIHAANIDQRVDGCAAGAGSDTIQLGEGTYQLGLAGCCEDLNQSGDLDIYDDLTIVGAGMDRSIIDGGSFDRVLDFVVVEGTYAIRDLTVQHGKLREMDLPMGQEQGSGGNIQNIGSLHLLRARVSEGDIDCQANGSGAAVANAGSLLVQDSRIEKNRNCDSIGGGIYSSGSLLVEDSIFIENFGYTAADLAIFEEGSTAVIRRTTFQGSRCGPGDGLSMLRPGAALRLEDVIMFATDCRPIIDTYGTLDLKRFDGRGEIFQTGGRVTVQDSYLEGRFQVSNPPVGEARAEITSSTLMRLDVTSGQVSALNSRMESFEMNGGAVAITSSTISGGSGGARVTAGVLALESVTIANNQGDTPALWVENSRVTIHNSLIANNHGPAGEPANCQLAAGTTTSLGYNLIGVRDGCNWVAAAGDLLGTRAAPIDPLLGPLSEPEDLFTPRVYPLLAGSPAINAADPANFPGVDQRGVPRPQGGRADIGAFEVRLGEDIQGYWVYLPVAAR